jgi:hypothetical protein
LFSIQIKCGEDIVKWHVMLFLIFGYSLGAHAQANPAVRSTSRQFPVNIDSVLHSQNQEMREQKNIIVEFKDEPMFLARRNPSGLNRVNSADQYRSRFSQFAADAVALHRLFRSSSPYHLAVRHEYYRAFFGISMSAPAGMLAMIQNLPYVKTVHFDWEVHATIEPGIALIGAPSVWTAFGTQGEGVRVGIIDSGVDYLHPALGGGIGPGFKVAGGYDFVNNDSDPMDDNGHGTHVAGIVAADLDTVKGVAPRATLYAYKALNAAGNGLESDIIAAIERAVDPNEDGDDSDRLDVVNMSFGTNGGSPTDPSSVAVDNASRLGVVFCVAAGNSGGTPPVEGEENNYFYDGAATISSPGTAELAITVGASDSSDARAFFSSKGPNRISFSIKPEVLAPGVAITSTYLSSGYATLSGTSMSTPMVTGVAALIKSVHPGWYPALIKSAIVNTARNLGLGANLQGGGRVRALQAVAAKTLVVPSTLSFGMDDPSTSTWVKPDTLYVSNKHSSTQSYIVTAGGLTPGISLDVSPASFSISANDSARVIVALSVNNAQILNEDHNILRYSGAVAFNGTVDTANVPWAFARTNRLVITTSEPNAFFLGFTNAATLISTERRVIWRSPTRAEVFAFDRGVYEFFTFFRNPAGKSKIVINEGIPISTDAAELTLDGANAVFPLVYHGVDHMGVSLDTYSRPQRTLISTFPNFGDWITTLTGGSDTLLVSPVSTGHSFKPIEFQIDVKNTGTFHIVQYDTFTGMNGARTVTNSPAGYIQEHFRVKVPPGTPRAVNVLLLYAYTNTGGTGTFGGLGFGLDTVTVGHDEYAFTGYFGKSSSPTEDIAALFYTSYSDVQRLSLDYQSPFIMPYGDSIVAVARELVTPAIPRFESGSTMTFGGPPIHLLMLWYPNIIGTNTLQFRTLFRGMLNEDRNIDGNGGTYSLFDRNGVHLFTKPLDDPRQPLQLTADRYRMVVSSGNYWLRNARGSVTLTSEFDLAKGFNSNPPSVTSLTLLDGKRHTTDSFVKGEHGTLEFSFNDLSFAPNVLPLFDSTKAWYRKHGTTQWNPLAVTKVIDLVDFEGTVVRADLGAATQEDSTAVDLRIASADMNGFTTDYIVSPAFAVGDWDTATATGVTPPGNQNIPGQFALAQNFPNPFNPSTIIRYGLPARSRVKLTVFNTLGQQVRALVNESQEAGSYEVRFDATGLASGMYFYRLQAGDFMATKRLLILR